MFHLKLFSTMVTNETVKHVSWFTCFVQVSSQPEHRASDTHRDPTAAQPTVEDGLMSPSSDRSKVNTRKRRKQPRFDFIPSFFFYVGERHK